MTLDALDAAYVLLVAGAAMIWPPLALIVAGAYLVTMWLIGHFTRSAPPVEDAAP